MDKKDEKKTFYLGHLLCEDAKIFHKKITDELIENFDLQKLKEKNRPAHITFKGPFLVNEKQILEVEKTLEEITGNWHKGYFELHESMRYFVPANTKNGRILYIPVMPKESMLKANHELIERMECIPFIEETISVYDIRKSWHSTILREKDLDKKVGFEDILTYVSSRDIGQRVHKGIFNNLTIFTKDKKSKKTEIYRTYQVNGE